MGNIIVPGGCIQQPQQAPNLNGDDPLTQGLVMAVIALAGNVFYEVISNQTAKSAGTSRPRQCVDGNQAGAISNIGAGASGAVSFPKQTGMDRITGPLSLFIEGSLEVNTTEKVIIKSYEDGNGRGFGLAFDDTSVGNNHFRISAANGSEGTGCNGALGSNSEQFTHRVAATYDQANVLYYAKRQLQATRAFTNAVVADASRRTYLMSSFTFEHNASSSLILAYNRIISLNEYQALFDNPWRVFAASPRRLWSSAAGASFQAAWAVNSTVTIQSARAA